MAMHKAQEEKNQRKAINEDKLAADFYETQNRLMDNHMEYLGKVKKYRKWLEKEWEPFMKEKQKEKMDQMKEAARLQQEAIKTAGVADKPIDPSEAHDSNSDA